VVSCILATGAAASFGMIQDLKIMVDVSGLVITHFIDVTNAAASLCFVGFLLTFVSSVFSSFALPKLQHKQVCEGETETEMEAYYFSVV
ncbi:UNVERIFIED_CONTAM: CASP-like protein PIMP1, partial [Sesamum indicum]